MDYENSLMEDFESGSDGEQVQTPQMHPSAPEWASPSTENTPTTLFELLEVSKSASVEQRLQQLDAMRPTHVRELSQVISLIPAIREELAKYSNSLETEYMDLMASIRHQNHSQEYLFLVQLSELPVLINDEIALLRRHVALRYKVVFPELDTLVSSPVDYCRIVLEIGQDLAGIRAHEPQLKNILAGEKVLTIVMAALQQFSLAFQLNAADMDAIFKACEACVELESFLREVSTFIAAKLAKYAPNVAEIIGAVATSQLLVSTGSLALLALTPSCNLPSFGVRNLLSHQKSRPAGFVRATGYIYQCPLVKGLPPEIIKQALRIISGKVVLAARIDLSRSCPDGSVGRQYKAEVVGKIDKLLAPPELSATKALPVPKEQKLKKRGGRRFRKMKERFQMSDLRKAQNKMLFGHQELSVVDGFGEEVGLGMSRQLDGIQVNRNTDARMSKAMVSRLQQQKERETLDTIVLAPEGYEGGKGDKKRRHENSGATDGQWGTMKRQRLDEEEI